MMPEGAGVALLPVHHLLDVAIAQGVPPPAGHPYLVMRAWMNMAVGGNLHLPVVFLPKVVKMIPEVHLPAVLARIKLSAIFSI